MTDSSPELLNQFKPSRIILPILLGLGIAGVLIWNNFDQQAWNDAVKDWETSAWFWLLAAIVCMFIRDLAYMYRIRILTDRHLTWRRSFVVILLWEFASAITPSIVGGTAFALLILAKEKISAGRSTAIVLLTAFLDELFFVVMAPLMLVIVGYDDMFAAESAGGISGFGLRTIFWIGYSILAAYTLFLAFGLFFNPKFLRAVIIWIFKLPFLKKWRDGAKKAGDDVIQASKELSGKPWSFWIKAYGSTIFSWTARYMVINCIMVAFGITLFYDHFVIYARQIFMWVIMLIPITPGGAGLAEYTFGQFLGEYIPGLKYALSLLWRMISYYPYLIIGAFLLPIWLRNKFRRISVASRKGEGQDEGPES